jgi:hypothetical protein
MQHFPWVLAASQKPRYQKPTKLAAALAFPCSLFLKSQLPELLPVNDSVDGTVINLSCNSAVKPYPCEQPRNYRQSGMETRGQHNTWEKLSPTVQWDMARVTNIKLYWITTLKLVGQTTFQNWWSSRCELKNKLKEEEWQPKISHPWLSSD